MIGSLRRALAEIVRTPSVSCGVESTRVSRIVYVAVLAHRPAFSHAVLTHRRSPGDPAGPNAEYPTRATGMRSYFGFCADAPMATRILCKYTHNILLQIILIQYTLASVTADQRGYNKNRTRLKYVFRCRLLKCHFVPPAVAVGYAI